MAIETITIPLSGSNQDYSITSYISGDKDDNQIVTLTDGGSITGEVHIRRVGHHTPTEAGAGPGGDDEFHLDLSTFNDTFDITVKSMDPGDVFYVNGWDTHTVTGSFHTFTYTGTDGNTHTVTINAVSTNSTGTATVVCFVRGTLISTPDGPVPIEQLSMDDIVQCGDGLARPIQWIGSRVVPSEELEQNPNIRPVLLRADAIEEGVPHTDLMLSPQHRIVLEGVLPELLFGDPRVLTAATHMENDHSILRQHDCREVEYFHILLDGHHTVFANGLEAETLFLGDAASQALGPEARSEIFTIFPEFQTNLSLAGTTCLTSLNRKETTALTGWYH